MPFAWPSHAPPAGVDERLRTPNRRGPAAYETDMGDVCHSSTVRTGFTPSHKQVALETVRTRVQAPGQSASRPPVGLPPWSCLATQVISLFGVFASPGRLDVTRVRVKSAHVEKSRSGRPCEYGTIEHR